MCIEEFFVLYLLYLDYIEKKILCIILLYILYLDYIEKILCIIFYKLCIVVCIDFINLYI